MSVLHPPARQKTRAATANASGFDRTLCTRALYRRRRARCAARTAAPARGTLKRRVVAHASGSRNIYARASASFDVCWTISATIAAIAAIAAKEGRAFPPDVVSASRDAVRRRAHRRYGPRRDARVSRGRDRRRIVTGRLRTRVAPKRRAKLHRRTARDGGDDDTSHRGRGECGGRGRGRGRGEGGEGGGRGRGRGRGEGGERLLEKAEKAENASSEKAENASSAFSDGFLLRLRATSNLTNMDYARFTIACPPGIDPGSFER